MVTRKSGNARKFRTALVGGVAALVAAAGIGSGGAQLPQAPAPHAVASSAALDRAAVAPLGYGDDYSVYGLAARPGPAAV